MFEIAVKESITFCYLFLLQTRDGLHFFHQKDTKIRIGNRVYICQN